MEHDVVPSATHTRVAGRSPWLTLILATIGFAVNFWAWALLSPLGPVFRDSGVVGKLSEWQVSLIVAVPVIVGSLGRIAVGALTDKYGGRGMLACLDRDDCAGSFSWVLRADQLSSVAGWRLLSRYRRNGVRSRSSVRQRVVPTRTQGPCGGIFGAGMGGTAISALTTVKLYTNVGERLRSCSQPADC